MCELSRVGGGVVGSTLWYYDSMDPNNRLALPSLEGSVHVCHT